MFNHICIIINTWLIIKIELHTNLCNNKNNVTMVHIYFEVTMITIAI